MRTSISVHFFNVYVFYLYGFNKGFDGTGWIYVCRYYSMLLNCLRIEFCLALYVVFLIKKMLFLFSVFVLVYLLGYHYDSFVLGHVTFWSPAWRYKKWHISVVNFYDEEPACSKCYTLCDSFLIIHLLIFLELWCCRLCIPWMQSTNSEYGSPYLAKHHFTFTKLMYAWLRKSFYSRLFFEWGTIQGRFC